MASSSFKPTVLIFSGPTATGKSALAIKMGQKHKNIEIINFDSLLFYKELQIGTAKPTKEELELVPHHLVGTHTLCAPLNAHDFELLAVPLIGSLIQQGKTPLLAGGSGFYLQAVMKGMFNSPSTPKEIMERSQALYDTQGIAPFWEILGNVDAKSAAKLHINDHYRIRRAVEHFWANGTAYGDVREVGACEQRPWEFLHLHFDIPKEDHQKVIERRTDKMIEEGLIDEVRDLLERGFSGQERPLQSIGYKETQNYLKGQYKGLKEYREAIIISTRQLAKAQRTWFNKVHPKTTFNSLTQEEEILNVPSQLGKINVL